MINRRRFIAITGALITAGVPSQASRWNGIALGSDATITLRGDSTKAKQALDAAIDTLRRLERQFSLFDTASVLSRLNQNGHAEISPEFSALCDAVDHVFDQTEGLFDPTIQPLWAALKNNPLAETKHIIELIGWPNVHHSAKTIAFTQNHMRISLNGIAQGFVTDRVRKVLAAYGFEDTIVNIGEYAVGNRDARIGIANPQGEILRTTDLRNSAIATTSPSALMLTSKAGHILHPQLGAVPSMWDTISVRAKTACFADAYSTALALSNNTLLAQKLVKNGEATHIYMRSNSGKDFEI